MFLILLTEKRQAEGARVNEKISIHHSFLRDPIILSYFQWKYYYVLWIITNNALCWMTFSQRSIFGSIYLNIGWFFRMAFIENTENCRHRFTHIPNQNNTCLQNILVVFVFKSIPVKMDMCSHCVNMAFVENVTLALRGKVLATIFMIEPTYSIFFFSISSPIHTKTHHTQKIKKMMMRGRVYE